MVSPRLFPLEVARVFAIWIAIVSGGCAHHGDPLIGVIRMDLYEGDSREPVSLKCGCTLNLDAQPVLLSRDGYFTLADSGTVRRLQVNRGGKLIKYKVEGGGGTLMDPVVLLIEGRVEIRKGAPPDTTFAYVSPQEGLIRPRP